jgi:hypothetical protein
MAFVDPVVDDEISGLEAAGKDFHEAIVASRWQDSHTALLVVCRAGQRIRLEIGTLSLLDRQSRARTADALQKVVDLLIACSDAVKAKTEERVPLEKSVFQEKIAGYVARFAGDAQSWAQRAAINIFDRLEETEGRTGPELNDA